MKPIKPEIPQVKRERGKRQNESADQERAVRPVNAIDRDTENHGKEYRRPVLKIS